MNDPIAPDGQQLAPFPDFVEEDDSIVLDEFVAMCCTHEFIDYDGFGYWACGDGYLKSVVVRPSQVQRREVTPPDWATHVLWFNR